VRESCDHGVWAKHGSRIFPGAETVPPPRAGVSLQILRTSGHSPSRYPPSEPPARNAFLLKDSPIRSKQVMSDQQFRIEKDSMGEVKVPMDALYAAQTQRAVENFPISGIRFPRPFIRALGMV